MASWEHWDASSIPSLAQWVLQLVSDLWPGICHGRRKTKERRRKRKGKDERERERLRVRKKEKGKEKERERKEERKFKRVCGDMFGA